MKKKIIRNKIKEQLLKTLTEESFKASENDPTESCSGRGACCISLLTNQNVNAYFKMDHNKRVKCRCPKGTRKVVCQK